MSKLEQQIQEWARSNLPIYEFMDLNIDSVRGGIFRCSVPLNENTGNHLNTMHAAIQFAAAEILGGIAVIAGRADQSYVPLVRDLKIHFKKPVVTGITAEISFPAEQTRLMNDTMAKDNRYDFELSATVKNERGEVVAETIGNYSVRKLA